MIRYTRHLFRISILTSVLLLLTSQVGLLIAQPVTFDDGVFTSKTFPLFSLIQQDTRLSSIIKKDRALNAVAAKQSADLAGTSCGDVQCFAGLLSWTGNDIATVGDELIRLYQKKKRVRALVSELRRGHYYPLYENSPDTALLRSAWLDAAKGMNHIFDVYIRGEKPRYAKIDSISFAPGDTSFKRIVYTAMHESFSKNNGPFYTSRLSCALQILKINGRAEAVNYEPMH